jgi:hypothetical protein
MVFPTRSFCDKVSALRPPSNSEKLYFDGMPATATGFAFIAVCTRWVDDAMGVKRKLLIVAGAGSAIEFGMPSVDGIHDFLLGTAARFFPLAADPSKNLYGFMHQAIHDYWTAKVSAHLGKMPNFEDVLYAIYALASIYPAGTFTGPLGAFVTIKSFPDVNHIGRDKLVDQNVLRHLGQQLVDDLMAEFRQRCRQPEPLLAPRIEQFRYFLSVLGEHFDVAAVTTNYDDLIYRCLPGIETGFDLVDGRFKQGRIMDRPSWPCLLHMHGSVHFDMDHIDGNLHGVIWQDDLNKQFHQNSFGRSAVRTTEGNEFPTSSIIAGYGKTEQIQRAPFRTYYSELDRLVHHADIVLLLGFSLADAHVRQAFSDYRDGRDRPVVCIDYADNGTMLAGSNFDHAGTGAARAVRVFRVPRGSMKWLGYKHAENVNALKAAREFERCAEPGRRLSIWYNGMLEACANTEKVVRELRGGA